MNSAVLQKNQWSYYCKTLLLISQVRTPLLLTKPQAPSVGKPNQCLMSSQEVENPQQEKLATNGAAMTQRLDQLRYTLLSTVNYSIILILSFGFQELSETILKPQEIPSKNLLRTEKFPQKTGKEQTWHLSQEGGKEGVGKTRSLILAVVFKRNIGITHQRICLQACRTQLSGR